MDEEVFTWLMSQLDWKYDASLQSVSNNEVDVIYSVDWYHGFPYFCENPLDTSPEWIDINKWGMLWVNAMVKDKVSYWLVVDKGLYVEMINPKKTFLLEWTNRMGLSLALSTIRDWRNLPVFLDWLKDEGVIDD